MRVLGIGKTCDLGDMYLRLVAGHQVKVYSEEHAECGVMRGMLEHISDFRAELRWVRAGGDDGLIVFEDTDHGAEQDQLRARGFNVIGASAFGCRLENDREFGQAMLAEVGLKTASAHRFHDFERAIAFIRRHPGRYVFKLDGNATSSWRNYVGKTANGSDMVALLRGQKARFEASFGHADVSFLLMEYKEGVETGIGAYFNGERFLEPACLDWEHKRFFPSDLGELTGEMGTLVTYRDSEKLFGLSLAKLAPLLRDSGYVGYINLNTIINEDGIWPLELTCRFGYPGFAILDALQVGGWPAVLAQLKSRESTRIATRSGFAIGVVLTVPPFPYRHGYVEISRGLPILFDEALTAADYEHVHFGEVERDGGGELVASGSVGYLMVVTGHGPTVEHARRDAYARAARVHVPNLRYRHDIGDAFLREGRARLQALGYLP